MTWTVDITFDDIRRLRGRGLTQEEVARELGTSDATVSRWERGEVRRTPRISNEHLRERIPRERVGEIARRLGWKEYRVRAALGYKHENGRVSQTTVAVDVAVAIIEAAGIDPWEVGL